MGSHLTYCKLVLDSPCGNPRVSFTLRINDKFTWVLLVGGYQILPSDSALLSGLPSSLVTGKHISVFSCTVCRALVTFSHVFTTVSGVVEVLERVDILKVCPGNADEKFSSLRSFRKGMFSAGIPNYLALSPHSSHQCYHSTGETRTATVEHNTLGHSTIRQADMSCYWRIAVHRLGAPSVKLIKNHFMRC